MKSAIIDNSFSITLLPLKKNDKSEWSSFIETISNATYFSSTDYLEIFNYVYFILIKNKDNQLIAGLPIIVKTFLPCIGNLFKTCSLESAILCDYSLTNTELLKAKRNVLLKLNEFLKKEGVVYCYISHWIRSNDSELFSEQGFNHNSEGTVLIDLYKEEKEISKNFKSGFKHALNKARRLGVSYNIEEGLDANYLVKEFCFLRSKTQDKARSKNKNASMMLKSEEFVYKILASKNNKTYLTTAIYEGKIAHIVLFVTFHNTMYAYLSGSNVQLNKKSGAANYLYYKTILFAKSNGLKWLDMGGTPIDPDKTHPAYGVYFFKRSFGGELKVYDGGYLLSKKIQGKVLRKLIENRSIVNSLYSILKFK